MSDRPFTFRGQVMPPELRESLDRYAQHGVPVGHFLEAVLANDLLAACGRADDQNLFLIPVIAAYVYNELPIGCHGSREIYRAWIKRLTEKRKA